MIQSLLSIFEFFNRRKGLLYVLFAITICFFLYCTSKIRFEENILQMLPQDEQSEKLTAFMENSRFSDRIMMVVSDKDTLSVPEPENLIAFTNYLIDSIQTSSHEFINQINYKSEPEQFEFLIQIISNNLPVFLDSSDYHHLDTLLTHEGIRQKLESNYRTLVSPSGIALKQLIAKDPLGFNFMVLKKFEKLRGDEPVTLFDDYYLHPSLHHQFIFIDPAFGSGKTKENISFFKRLNAVIDQVKQSHPGYDIHYFGAPAVAAGNSEQIRKDTFLTISITVICLLVIFLLFFRSAATPLLIMIPVATGGLFALSVIYLIQGSISVIALGAGSLILGIAVNYSLHFLTHYRFHPDKRRTLKDLALPMTAGSATTIGGFLCLQFVNAPVLQDLGLYAALSLTGAAFATLVFLPHFLNSSSGSHSPRFDPDDSAWSRVSDWMRGNKKLAITFAVATPILLYFAKGIGFESDMNRVNFMSENLKASEKFINRFSSYYQKSVFTISGGNTLDEALQAEESRKDAVAMFVKEGKVLSNTAVSGIFPSVDEQQKRINLWNRYWENSKRDSAYNMMTRTGSQLGFSTSAFDPFIKITDKQYNILSNQERASIQNSFLSSFIEQSDGMYSIIGFIKTTDEYSHEVTGKLGSEENFIVFDRKYVTDKLAALVQEDFNFITIWTSLLVFAALLLVYGRIELALISFIPMVLSWIWILGIMALAGINFNIINIVLSTLIFALGDDYCIFTTDGLRQRYARKANTSSSTSVSIALSAITTIAGMGVLIFAQHPALRSIALVSIIGIFSVWFISQVVQPLLFRILITNPTSAGHQPYTFFDTIKSVFAFTYFVTGSVLISAIGFIMFRMIPGKSAGKKYIYHFILSKFAGSMIYIMANVKKTIINETNENFARPAIIIANHSSFLDILLMVMLHPKLILLTNSWVWNSPVFGLAVRLAEYYPVSEGAENTISKLSDKVNDGYSIVVFPEGTRSVDGKIGRFHKGAFYLANHLKLDILPILIHGAHYTMTKGFFFLKNGRLTIKFLPRIKSTDPVFSTPLRDQAKSIGQWFRNEHAALRREIETTRYFRNQLIHNFIFKGPVLEWYLKIKLKLENNYEMFDKIIPREASVTDMGCGYGFLAYMLSFTSSGRNITAIDYDEDKIGIAGNGYLKSERLQFVHADLTQYEPNDSDVFIINDVLHYLDDLGQKQLLDKCVEKLRPGGLLIVRDGIMEYKKRHRGTRLTELFSTTLLGFNKTSGGKLNFISLSLIQDTVKNHGLTMETIDNTQLTSNITFVLKKTS